MNKKLYRNTQNKMISGVCSGLADYLNIDPTLVRVLWVLLGLFAFAGVILYIVCMFIIPEKPSNIIDEK